MSATARTEKTIFLAAAEIAAANNRAAFLDRACAGEPQLRAAVEALLHSHQQSQGLLDATAAPLAQHLGTMVGPYKLLQQIGEGGMGVVYMAEQTEPVQRRVALKIIKPGMDSRQVIARFAAEKQALALMDHVNIARVLDAGTTGSEPGGVSPGSTPPAHAGGSQGRPYFVMELVHGVPITKYCDDNHLTPRQRLELFVPVCQAIQHAHQKGIIHRDIKPSNVMVTLYDGKPVPKVIDFGVAKATEQKLTEQTLFTQYGTMVGTLEYMSPEQAEMSALGVDTRSDIYSLGVLLYELLTGSTPLSRQQMKEAAYGEILRLIRDVEPPKPSTRLSDSGEALASISALRQTEPAKLSKLMRGELDWIVMKTLEKDRNRRYDTANGFAADVQRYLNDEPVQACPPSAAYRFRKFARRNRAALVMASVLGLAILLAVGALGWAMRDRAAREMELAQERRERQAKIAGQVELILDDVERFEREQQWPEALAAAQRAGVLIAGAEGNSDLEQEIQEVLTELRMVQRLDELRAQNGDHPDHDSLNRAYARLFADFGIDVEALGPPEIAARIRRRSGTAVRLVAGLDEWAIILRDWALRPEQKHLTATWKRLVEAARLADTDPWLNELRRLMGAEDVGTLRKLADSANIATLSVQSCQLMGNALVFNGDGPAGVAWLRKAHQQHPGDTLISFGLAFHLGNLPSADPAEVLRFAEAALAARPKSAAMYGMVGSSLARLNRLDEAILHYRRALELKADDALAHARLGIALGRQGKADEAIACYRKALELDPKLGMAHNNLIEFLLKTGRLDEAIVACRGAINVGEFEDSNERGWLSVQLNNTAWRLAMHSDPKRRDPVNAVELANEAVRLMPDAHWNTLGAAHYRAGDYKSAVAALERSLKVRKGGDSFDWFFLATAHWRLGDKVTARKWYDLAVAWMDKNQPTNDELRRFRAEAAEVLGVAIEVAPPPRQKK